MPHSTHHSRDIWLALGLAALLLALGAPAASAQTEPPKVDGPTSGPEGLAQPPAETAPAIPSKSAIPERVGSSLEERKGEVARPEGPTPLPERPAEPSGAPKEIR
jgi:hypothetical protein